MDKLVSLKDELNVILINLKKSINRPYTEPTKEAKKKEIQRISDNFNDIHSKIVYKYLESEQIVEIKNLITIFKDIKSSALNILNAGESSSESQKTDDETNNDISEITNDVNNSNDSGDQSEEMAEKFDLRAATHLLPTLDGKEETVNALIDAISLYDEMLANDSKPMLVKFVLKTRLDASSKLKLKTEYSSATALINDMKKVLLAKKSATALAAKLNSMKQKDKPIDKYGQEIEELFVQMTIAQADGNSATYEILKPTNEKQAIAAFANGLRNAELKTIIKAREYKQLNHAIRGALDEERGGKSEENVYEFKHNGSRPKTFHRGTNRYRNYQQNGKKYNNFNNNKGNRRFERNNKYDRKNNSNYKQNNNQRNENRNNNNFRGRQNQNIRHYQNQANTNNNSNENIETNNNEETLQFFRA